MLKTSEYNFMWPLEGSDSAVIFNSFSGAVMEIKKHQLDLLAEENELDPDILDDDTRKTVLSLSGNGFMIESFVDEKKFLMHRNTSGRYDRAVLSLTILPTLDCNLKCFYCFQERNPVDVMTPEIQENIEQFVLKSINGVKHIKVCWFGGEPLLGWDIICRLSDRLLKIAQENGCKYEAVMVSNGYLFDDSKIEKLKDLKVRSVQITLDGPPNTHSRRKGIQGNAQDNFDKITGIIEKLQKNNVKVSIRVNIDKTNMNEIDELLDILSDLPLGDATIYPALVTPYTQVCSNVADACLNTDEFAGVEVHFYKRLMELGLSTDLSRVFSNIKENFCCADQINSFIIGVDGYMYKCWNTVGNKNEIISDVMNRPAGEYEKKLMKMRQMNWITWNPFGFEECVNCKMLPLCMGGCPYKYKELNNGRPDCMSIKSNLQEMVLSHFYYKKVRALF